MQIPASLVAVAEDQAGLVSTRQCDRQGLAPDTRTRLARDGRLSRVTRGVYEVPDAVPDTGGVSQRWALSHARQIWLTLLAAPDDAIPVGLTALAVHGLWGLPRSTGCQVTYGRGRHADGPPGVHVRQFGTCRETTLIGGRAVPTMTEALIQSLPEVGRDLAVVLVDNALNRGLLDERGLARVRRGVRGRRGAARLHDVWPLVDGRSESPIETRARLECHDAGIPPDALQVALLDAGDRFLGRGDLGWRTDDGAWVIVEMDGIQIHEQAPALFRDRARQNAILTRSPTKATILRFTSADLATGAIPQDVRRALS